MVTKLGCDVAVDNPVRRWKTGDRQARPRVSGRSLCVAADHTLRVAGDHSLFICRDDANATRARVRADHGLACLVARVVERYAEVGEVATDALADAGRVLADTAGEDEGVDSPSAAASAPSHFVA